MFAVPGEEIGNGDVGYSLGLSSDFGGAGTPCMPTSNNCMTSTSILSESTYRLPGQNVWGGITASIEGEPSDGVNDNYVHCNQGDRMQNAEGCWVQYNIAEDATNVTFGCASGCSTGSQSMITGGNTAPLGVGRTVAANAIWTGTGAAGAAGAFYQVNLPGRTDAASTVLQIGSSTGYGNSITVSINASPSLSYATGSTAALSVGEMACMQEMDTSGSPGYWEQETITAVTSTTVTFAHLDYAHSSNAVLAVGGLCGYGLEDTGATSPGVRPAVYWPILGSLNSSGTVLLGELYQGGIISTGTALALHQIAKVESSVGLSGGANALTLSPNLIAFNTSTVYTEGHGRNPIANGVNVNVTLTTPSPVGSSALITTLNGYAVANVNSHAWQMNFGASPTGAIPLSAVQMNGITSNRFEEMNPTTGAFFTLHDQNLCAVGTSGYGYSVVTHEGLASNDFRFSCTAGYIGHYSVQTADFNAAGYLVNGTPGITKNVVIGSCTLTYTAGLLTSTAGC